MKLKSNEFRSWLVILSGKVEPLITKCVLEFSGSNDYLVKRFAEWVLLDMLCYTPESY